MIPQFALRLICGLSLLWCLMPDRNLVTAGYFRIQMLITLGLGVLLALTSGQLSGDVDAREISSTAVAALGIILAALSFFGSIVWTLGRRRVGSLVGLLLAIISMAAIARLSAAQNTVGPLGLTIIENISSAWLLGFTTGTMLLGHWYLTATGMSLEPFKKAVGCCAGVAAFRILVSVAESLLTPETSQEAALLLLHWAGMIGPLALSLLTVRILRYRNTQSATGVLYASTILVFMGEMANALLISAQANPAGV